MQSHSFDYDLLCIGSGPAGQRGAVQAAKFAKRVAVIERRGTLGGACVDTGTIPSKTLREAVLWIRAGQARSPAMSPVRPTAAELLERVAAVVAGERAVIAGQLVRNHVDVFCGEAAFRDPHTIVIRSPNGTRECSAASILIATGTETAATSDFTPDGEIILTSDDVTRLKTLPRTLAVVGAGVVGIEFASMFAALGVDVTVVDRRDRPLEFLDAEIVDELIHQMRKQTVTFRFGEAVERLEVSEGPPRRAVLWLESGKRIVADMALFSVGRQGATAKLGLAAARLVAAQPGRPRRARRRRARAPRGRHRLPDRGAAHFRRGRRDWLSESGRHLERTGAPGRLSRDGRGGRSEERRGG